MDRLNNSKRLTPEEYNAYYIRCLKEEEDLWEYLKVTKVSRPILSRLNLASKKESEKAPLLVKDRNGFSNLKLEEFINKQADDLLITFNKAAGLFAQEDEKDALFTDHSDLDTHNDLSEKILQKFLEKLKLKLDHKQTKKIREQFKLPLKDLQNYTIERFKKIFIQKLTSFREDEVKEKQITLHPNFEFLKEEKHLMNRSLDQYLDKYCKKFLFLSHIRMGDEFSKKVVGYIECLDQEDSSFIYAIGQLLPKLDDYELNVLDILYGKALIDFKHDTTKARAFVIDKAIAMDQEIC